MATGESINIDNLSDEIFDLLCSICKHHGKHCEAEKYCVECDNYYCLVCVKVHEDVALLSGHKIIDKTSRGPSVSQQGSGLTLPAPTERCNKHNHYYIDMYCQTHDDVGCPACIATDHRKFRKEINDRLDKLEQNSIHETESLYRVLIEETEKAAKEVQTNQPNIKSAQNKLASPGNNVSQIFVNSKKGNKTAKMASKWIEENKTQIPVVDIDFQADQRLSQFLEEINTLGNVIQRNMKDKGIMAGSVSNLRNQQATDSQSTRQKKYLVTSDAIQQREVLLQGRRQKNYTVKVKSDKSDCDIYSACALEDGTVILSDYNNKKLKRLDSSTYTVTDYCNLPCRPWQVCPISKQEVAVCLPSIQVVQFISVGSRMKRTREINTDFRCYGLAYTNDNLYISDSDTSVYIYSMTGSKLKQFSLYQSRPILYSIYKSLADSKDGQSLAVSKVGSRIYVTDWDNQLIVLDNNGQVVGQFKQLRFARGCYLTDTGCLLVCGYNSNNVLQFGPDGEWIGEVVKCDINKGYQAVCCNQQMSKLIVGSHFNDIEVYDLVEYNNKL